MPACRLLAFGLVGLSAVAGMLASVTAHAATPQLLRNPYLTDDTSNHAMIELATSLQSPAVTVAYGPTPGCTGASVNATGSPITVNGVSEYQFKFALSGLTAGSTYCYSVAQSGVTLYDNTGGRTTFHTALASTDSRPFSFAVFGDWGSVPTGSNPQLAALMGSIHTSGASFAITAGDNAYNSGTQTNYGDLVQTGNNVSAVFANQFWGQNGASIPLFADPGDHGFSIPITYFLNFNATATAADSAGKYVSETYSGGPDGITSTKYPSVWYAFDWGNARFYVLSGVWGDTNQGSATGAACGTRHCPAYQVDYDYHWAPGSPELTWLTQDLQAHSGTPIKFAFFHFPLHVDNATEQSDPYYGGANGLETLLADNNVTVAFNGKAHLYERNVPQVGSMVSYVTGAGGAPLEPITQCSSFDGYARGWSVTNQVGSACNGAVPTSQNQVNSYLLVTVNGNQVTVTPTDANGASFDVRTYTVSSGSGNATHFQLNVPQGATAGTAFNETITAQDASGSTDTTYNGNRVLTWSGLSNSPQPSNTPPSFPPNPVSFSGGRATVQITPYDAQTTALGVTDGSISGTSGSFTVRAAAASSIRLTNSAGSHSAASRFQETITALDPWSNNATSYTGTKSVTFSGPSSSPNGAAPMYPTSVSFAANGTAAPTIQLFDAQTTSLTATVGGMFTATSPSFTITPLSAKTFNIPNPGSQTVGSPFTLALTAQDQYGNTATTYSGKKPVQWSGASSSSSGQAPKYPASVTFTGGSGTATITLYAVETVNLQASCCPTSSTVVTGQTGSFSVNAGGAAQTAGPPAPVERRLARN